MRWTRLSVAIGLVAALLALGAYRIGLGATGVVLDTRPAAGAMVAVALIVAPFGLRRRGAEGGRLARRLAGVAAISIALLVVGLLVADIVRAGRTEEVSFASGDITLVGTFCSPGTGARPHPAIVLTHGAGRETRDEGRYYARLFARSGIAALAHDKRGSGRSGGDVDTATYQDLALDALAAVRYLAGRREVDRGRIGLWGVSEGGWVVPLAAAADRLAFAIVISVTAEGPAEQVRYEVGERVRRAGHAAATADRAADLYARVSAYERTGQGYDELAALLGAASREEWFDAAHYLPDELLPFEELTKRRWYPAWRANMDFDAASFWRRVRCPVLVLLGGRDPKIDAAQAAARIPAALLAGGNADVTVRIYPAAEHGLAEWWLPGRMPPPRFPEGYPGSMVDWALSRLTAEKRAG